MKRMLIAIQVERYKKYVLLKNVTTKIVIQCSVVPFIQKIWTAPKSSVIIGKKYKPSKEIRYLCYKSEEK